MSRQAHGLRAWVVQRVTALYMAVFFLVALFYLPGTGGVADYVTWRALLGNATVAVLTALFFLALLAHAWVGMRDVCMDYLRPAALRFAALVLLAVALLLAALSVLRSLFVVVLS